MRWKISHRNHGFGNHGHGRHDPRQIDLFAILALVIVIVAAFRFYTSDPSLPNTSALIVPSQSVRW
jgi:hypothetical protein